MRTRDTTSSPKIMLGGSLFLGRAGGAGRAAFYLGQALGAYSRLNGVAGERQ